MEISGRNVLLTGAAGGLGREIARRLASRGARLALSGRNEQALDELRRDLSERGASVAVVPADLADAGAAQRLVGDAEKELGPLDVVVCNAGIEVYAGYATHTRDELGETIAVNLLAPMLIVRSALPGMLERGSGAVVLVSSLSGKGPNPYGAAYAASKAGLVGLTASLRAEHRAAPVTFSVVCPGTVRDGHDGMYVRMSRAGLRAPRALGSTTVARCADAVLDVIRTGKPEVLVNSRPMRPLLALGQLFPSLPERVVDRMGVTRFFREVARSRDRV